MMIKKKVNGIKTGNYPKSRIAKEFEWLMEEIKKENRKRGNKCPITNTRITKEISKYFKINESVLKNEFIFIKK